MDDEKIIELYWQRNEAAIRESADKYGGLCFSIAANILASREDCEECVSDTWLGAWEAMPPARPVRLGAFLGKITRNLSLKKLEYMSAAKRSRNLETSLEELADCVSGEPATGNELESRLIQHAIETFLEGLTPDKRKVFILRYWYFEPVERICARTGWSRSKVKSMLLRLRKDLRTHLEKEGIEL